MNFLLEVEIMRALRKVGAISGYFVQFAVGLLIMASICLLEFFYSSVELIET